ncbi:MAG: hypothetical protein E6J68_12805 [Deltaproteobacteria bacterium]|nr:MAG: hypothetical protein E6J68_12805 [Deltaproteobacteria bacterium]
MPPAVRRYLLLEQGVGAAVFNFVLNAAIAGAMFRSVDVVPLWGQQSIMGDTIGTCFLLPLLTCLIATRLVRGHLRAGKVASLGWTRASHPVLGWLPQTTARRGIALLAPLAFVALGLLGVAGLPFWRFVLFKAAFAALAAALVTPLVALWAIAEAPVPRESATPT